MIVYNTYMLLISCLLVIDNWMMFQRIEYGSEGAPKRRLITPGRGQLARGGRGPGNSGTGRPEPYVFSRVAGEIRTPNSLHQITTLFASARLAEPGIE